MIVFNILNNTKDIRKSELHKNLFFFNNDKSILYIFPSNYKTNPFIRSVQNEKWNKNEDTADNKNFITANRKD
jgi:hypothetical protein